MKFHLTIFSFVACVLVPYPRNHCQILVSWSFCSVFSHKNFIVLVLTLKSWDLFLQVHFSSSGREGFWKKQPLRREGWFFMERIVCLETGLRVPCAVRGVFSPFSSQCAWGLRRESSEHISTPAPVPSLHRYVCRCKMSITNIGVYTGHLLNFFRLSMEL